MAIFPKILVAWGIILDLLLLFALPLLGNCSVMSELIKFTTCAAPLSAEATITVYGFALCGCVRALAGLFPSERGAWLACASSMLVEGVMTFHLDGMGPPVFICGSLFLYMAANVPPPASKKD
eukprot:TRINITY_DN67069_c0_g1_i1.p1 TRINITY_DN67069_c0_g1~~TRINITY_DN67069_c0_g1_i1.p1  ORF type:complete len:136 (-),score=20.57 TRINITY_DN67069_c0_g1_i1:87-455(-)